MTAPELHETLEKFTREHGLFHLQDQLIRALVKSVTVEKAEFTGPGFKIVIRNKAVKSKSGLSTIN